jgi:hypothetical protein
MNSQNTKELNAAAVSVTDWPVLSTTQLPLKVHWATYSKEAAKEKEEKLFKALIAQQPLGWIHTCLGDVWGRVPPPGYRMVLVVDEENSHSARTSFKPEYFKE